MDLLSILINQNKATNVCCLCYKKNENTTALSDNIEIHDEYFELNLTLENIFKNLFPSHELILTHICDDCSTLVIKVFCLFQNNYVKNEILNDIVDNIDEKIEEVHCTLQLKNKLTKCRLKINLPTNNTILDCKKNYDSVPCEKCLMKFKTKLLLRTHMQISHKNTNNAIICDICGKIFTKSSRLKAHLDCHTIKQCPHCSKMFKSYSHFKLHVKNHNTKNKIKRTMKYRKCTKCVYKTCDKGSLEAHINKVHLHIKPFGCDICQRTFYKKVHLKAHIITHNRIKEKTCDICGDAFVSDRTLREHQRLHKGEKPYKCDICDVSFITSGRRSEHMKRKHMDKTECCSICGKKFSLRKGLNAHYKTVHGSGNKTNLVVK